jgi:AhpD family alkylhydroperoxidase
MRLDDRTIRLIAVGASVSANCLSCLETNTAKARESGADEQEIAEAIVIGKMVRKGAASKMDKFVLDLNYSRPSATAIADGGCTCDTSA